jgi:hypothetical protein
VKSVPYASASTGTNARDEITRVLRRFGCEQIYFMDDYAKHEVLLAFVHRGRQVQLRASASGWARMFLKEQPWTYLRRSTQAEWEQAALRQGHIAVNSILRDWVKSQLTMIEAGILSFEAIFLPHMIGTDGRTLLERADDMLPRSSADDHHHDIS